MQRECQWSDDRKSVAVADPIRSCTPSDGKIDLEEMWMDPRSEDTKYEVKDRGSRSEMKENINSHRPRGGRRRVAQPASRSDRD